jgi:hypothetical protein
MKRLFYSFIFLCFSVLASSQTDSVTASYSGSTTPLVKYAGDMDSLGDNYRRGFMKFDLSGLPSGAVITNASLKYYHYAGGSSTVPNSVFAIGADPQTASPSQLYIDCGDANPGGGQLASMTWTNTVPFYYTTNLNTRGVDFLNTRTGTWAYLSLKRDTGGAAPYSFRGYTNANPPKLILTYYVPSPCNAAPATGTLIASNLYPCNGEQVTLFLLGTSVATGLTYQWQISPVGTGTWTNISGATSSTYSFTANTNNDYRVNVICASASAKDSSNIVSITTGGINAFPYSESFENGPGGWRGVNSGGGFNEWTWGTPAKTVIKSAASGNKCWITNLNFDYTDLSDYSLESPCFNFTNVSLPKISFSMRYLTEVDYDGLFLEYSANGGSSWTKVPQSDILTNTYNSYSTIAIFTPPAWSGDNGGWLRYTVSLPGLSGSSIGKIRVRFMSDNYVTDEGVAFDSVTINNTYKDISVTSLNAPVNACSGTSSNPVKITLTNLGLGLSAGTKIPVSYKMNNGSVSTDTIRLSSNKLIGDTIQYTFTATASLTSFGVYTFKIWTSMPGDSELANDTLIKTVTIFSITTNPYHENFETTDGGWTGKVLSGTAMDLEWGTPNKTLINAAASGTKCWNTRLVGNYSNLADYALESPCINLSTAISPVLSFSLRFITEAGFDGCILESSTNGGINWNKETNFIQGGYNNNSTVGILPPPTWSGASPGGWMRVKLSLASYAGQSNVKIRLRFASDDTFNEEGVSFDSVSITDLFSKDVGVSALVNPAGGCGLTNATTVTVKIKNYGKALPAGTKIPVIFRLIDFNSIPISSATDTLTLTTTLNAKDSINFTFNGKANLAAQGVYIFKSWTGLFSDSDVTNDTLFNIPVVSRSSITNFPYYENFETTNGDWYAEALNGAVIPEWDWNFPSKPVINFTPNGQQCWLSAPFSNYSNNAQNALFSPCLNFSNVNNPEISFLMRFKTQLNNDAFILESSINGGASWQKVDASNSQGQYNNVSTLGGIAPPKWSGDNLAWKTYHFNLANLAFQSNVQLRYRFSSDATINDEGIAIDSVVIFDNSFYDLKMAAVIAPISKCGLTANETVTVLLRNNGNLKIAANTAIPLTYKINSNPPVTETLTLGADMLPNATIQYTFNTTANLSAPGLYNFTFYSAMPTDMDYSNDTISNYSVSTKSLVSAFPYKESFGAVNPDWTTTGNANENWKITGAMNNPPLTPYSGSFMAVFDADLYSAGAVSRLISPCFDLSTLNSHATLSFFMTFNNLVSAKNDSLILYASTNGGSSWNIINSITRYKAAYASPGWGMVNVDISAYAGQAKVIFAFEAIGAKGTGFAIDDIMIYNTDIRIAAGTYQITASCPGAGGNQWIDLRDNNNLLIAQVNPNGNNLGNLCFGINIVNNPLRYERTGTWPGRIDQYYFVRNILLQSTIQPVSTVSVRLFYHPSEFTAMHDSVLNRSGANISKTDLQVLDYHNPSAADDLDVLNNDYTNGITSILACNDNTANGFNCFAFNVNYFGELGVVYRKPSVGILNKATGSVLKVYPNPARDELSIVNGYENLSSGYFIYNSLGQLLAEGEIDQFKSSINISSLAPGIYWLKIGSQVVKFEKENY